MQLQSAHENNLVRRVKINAADEKHCKYMESKK